MEISVRAGSKANGTEVFTGLTWCWIWLDVWLTELAAEVKSFKEVAKLWKISKACWLDPLEFSKLAL
ncbi:hypothetical protein WICPIJ_007854 [Wickerhamomyces pijperi]|uniref:Uncharacterized protein n=1 Tax=Wickerhamomyces pijperi TaxID=599730 RepID=A0A9P8Q1K6_WICPI|nr:hypothetical protein WICPIJ_007854 [Wickerhamomyces pijperi]